jgi:hypothetical protein
LDIARHNQRKILSDVEVIHFQTQSIIGAATRVDSSVFVVCFIGRGGVWWNRVTGSTASDHSAL